MICAFLRRKEMGDISQSKQVPPYKKKTPEGYTTKEQKPSQYDKRGGHRPDASFEQEGDPLHG